jgi:hypothetical protein
MASRNSFLSNVAQGFLNPKGSMGDWHHARALYTNDSFRLAPKHKFLYHVVFNLNATAVKILPQLKTEEINMLVKAVDMPKFNVSTSLKHQYNRKRNLQTRLDYDPISITFHDDNFGQTTAMWEAYYRYYFKDGNYTGHDGISPLDKHHAYNKGNTYVGQIYNKHRYGLDNDSFYSFFDSIQIFQLSRRRYTAFTLVNPMIQSWQHDSLDNNSSDAVQSTMQVLYETVWYSRGAVDTAQGIPKMFGSPSGHYDTTPSPITIGGGANFGGLFGETGLLSQGVGLLSDITGGQAFSTPGRLLGTILKGANIFKNAKGLSMEGIRQEGFGILKNALGGLGGISANNVGGVASSFFPKNSGLGSIISNITPTIAGIGGVTAGFAAVKSLASGGDILSTVTKAAGIGVLITTAADSPFGKKVINAGTDLAGGALDSIKSAFNDLPVEKQAEEIATATAAITSKSNDALAQVQRAGNAFTRSV